MSQVERRAGQLVSVIMPAHNAESTLDHAIRSVRAQTYEAWELLIVDDLSSDRTADIARDHAAIDPRVQLVRLEENRGPAGARNAALERAKGRFVAFLDADDYWLPAKLTLQVEFMSQNDIGFSYTMYRRIRAGDSGSGRLIELPSRLVYEDLLKNTAIACSTAMIDRQKAPPIVFPLIRHEDYALWLRLLREGMVAYCLAEDLACYRESSNSVSGNKLRSALWVWRVYRQAEGLTVPKAAWCLTNYAWRAATR
ncbi:MAG: glycosyltransferase family 2 protein [Chromatiales bacterium]|nr:glycosyltransferase family 2 protein [Chromatiales bacterium]